MSTGHSDRTTRGIRVRVGAQFLPEQSDPDRGHFAYAYRVIVSNEGDVPCKLLARHWTIRDARGEVREVRGAGVVGMQPWIQPGKSFEYMSGCPLTTEWGTMEGTYSMQTQDGQAFEAQIGRFFLAQTAGPLSLLDQLV